MRSVSIALSLGSEEPMAHFVSFALQQHLHCRGGRWFAAD
jgi:hypothetical protein